MESIHNDHMHFAKLDSTSHYLSEMMRAKNTHIPDYLTISADYQTAGRGQRANDGWESAPGKNLLFSILIRPKRVPIADQFLISEAVSLGILDVLSTYSNDMKIKWPNDIYYQDKKLGGLLIEHSLQGLNIEYSIAGFGLNVKQTTFRGSAPNPISLATITGEVLDRMPILENLRERIEARCEALFTGDENVIKSMQVEYMSKLFRYEEDALFADADGKFEGRIVGVSPQGVLTIKRLKTGELVDYLFKEVQHVLVDNDEESLTL